MAHVLSAAGIAGLLAFTGFSPAYGQVFTDFNLTDANTVVETMGLSNTSLTNNTVYDTGLSSGPTSFSYATRSFIPQVSGDYLIGNFSAGLDTAILLYADSFDPDNPAANFVAFNDDWRRQQDTSVLAGNQFVGFPGFDTADIETCSTSSRCPIVVAELDEARPYHIVVSQFSPSASFDLSTPIRLFVFGPGGAFFELPSSILARALAQTGVNANQVSLAEALEHVGSGHPLFDAVDAIISDVEFLAALEALSGATHAAHDGALAEQSAMVRNIVFARIRAAMNQPTTIQPLGYASVSGQEAVDDKRIWTALYGGFARTDDNGIANVDTMSGGLSVGADDWYGDFRLGLYGNLGRTATRANSAAAGLESTDFGLGLYGGTQVGQTTLSFGAGYQHHVIDSSRTVTAGGLTETLDASYHGGTAQLFAELAHGLPLSATTRLEAFGQLAFLHQHFDAFSENGGSAALTVEGRQRQRIVSTLGLRGEHSFILGEDVLATLSGSLAWQHAVGGAEPMTASFSGGAPFNVQGAAFDGHALVLEAGLNLDVTETTDLSFEYRGSFGDKATGHDIQASLSVKF